MKKLYLTNEARENAISEITREIEVLGAIKSDDLSYLDYRRITDNLSKLREMIKAEME